MNKNLTMTVLAGAALVLGAHLAFSDAKTEQRKAPKPKKPTAHIVLEKKNTVSFRTPFEASFVDDAKAQLIALDQSLPEGEHIFLYLRTPGGEIDKGDSLIDTIAGLSHTVDTITDFAASMGYMTVQSVKGSRYILPSGTLMAHRAYMGVEGQTPGQFDERVKFFEDGFKDLETTVASRIGKDHASYSDMVKNEYWVTGEKAVAAGSADQVATVSCSADLNGTYTQVLSTSFGDINIEWANCPLISSPRSIALAGGTSVLNEALATRQTEYINAISQVLNNPRSLTNTTILNKMFSKNVN